MRLLEHVWADVFKGYEASLKALETALGDDHNLVVLRETIASSPESYGSQAEVSRFVEGIAAAAEGSSRGGSIHCPAGLRGASAADREPGPRPVERLESSLNVTSTGNIFSARREKRFLANKP